jgi:Zn-finger protein
MKMNNFKGFTNYTCEFYPCHKNIKRDFNCLFCYCPLLHLECPGPYETFENKYGKIMKDCSKCTLPHDGIEQSWNFIQIWLSNSPPWDKSPQTKEKTRKYSKLVNSKFDKKDIEWAKNQI